MKKISFGKILSTWFIVAVALFILNSFTLKSSIAHSVILSLLGITLLIYPAYPISLENRYDRKQCRLFIRIIALMQIIFSFLIHTTF
ncbi:MAG: hypothetical protein PHP50_13485 [Lachnospiraceae bacterium]|nr:hypothetical protein [Lachnospiraceae bacterium]